LEALGYSVREVRFVDRRGRKRGGFPVAIFRRLTGDRFTSLRRTDLAAAICGALDGRADMVFGDSIAGIEQEEKNGRVRLRFDRAAPREVDLVVGADGLHSRVRGLAFGPEAGFELPLGHHVAAFELAGYRPRDELVFVSHNVPGRQVSRFTLRDNRTLFLFILRDEYLAGQTPSSDRERKSALENAFADAGWECPEILGALREASGDLYFDRVSQIRMDRWARGRAVLVGDAAACVSLLAGEGTGLAMAEAYVLAGELHRNAGDYAAAFARYQALMMPFLLRKQRAAARFASTFAPRTAFGIGFRDLVTRLLGIPSVANFFIGQSVRDDIELPDYRF
ncbi:MAG TPA: FAD-dependent monooxygenase, partial [Candidatus Competibacter sp.]|nr:FAD-dependent monooxygenase [Candidatus Competibacter sp.]